MPARSLDEHLEKFVRRMRNKWGHRPCLVDPLHIESAGVLENGEEPLSFVFNGLAANEAVATPAIHTSFQQSSIVRLSRMPKNAGYGLCLRLSIEELSRSLHDKAIPQLLARLRTEPHNCDLVIDIDMRLVRPSANIRYAIDDAWFIVKGSNVRDNGYEQFRNLC